MAHFADDIDITLLAFVSYLQHRIFLLELSDGQVIEIYRAAGQWLLSRIAD